MRRPAKARSRVPGRARALPRAKRGAEHCHTPRKRHFPDKAAALASIVGGQQRAGKVAPIRVYACSCGNGWCLTSKPEH